MRLFPVIITTALACAPVAPTGDCGPKNCLGCCDTSGQCKGGAAKDACGSGGFRCASCAVNQRCSAQTTCEVDPNAPPLGGGTADLGDAGPMPTAQEYVSAHNRARRRAMPVPSPALGDVTWDNTVAAFAKVGADRCVWGHRQQDTYGENLHASSIADTPTSMVEDWESEKAAYTYSTNACASVCGHYTQLVWRSTLRIGCATTLCTTGSPLAGGGPWYLTACNYDPPGNYVGMKPY